MKLKFVILNFVLFITSLTVCAQESDTLIIYPKAFKDTVNFEIKNLSSDTVTLQIFNRWGQPIVSFYEEAILSGDIKVFYVGDTLPEQPLVVMYIINSDTTGHYLLKLAPTVIEENELTSDDVNIFPNPTYSHVNIKAKKAFDSVAMFDLSGKKVLVVDGILDVNASFEIDNIEPGEYVIVIKQGTHRISKQIIIIE